MDIDPNRSTNLDTNGRCQFQDFKAGDIIAGKYEFVSGLGKGGMGKVCLCKALKEAGRQVALKMVTGEVKGKKKAEKALFEEFLKMLKLKRDNIVTVRGLEEDAYRFYIVMDFIEGQTLDAYLTDHPNPGFDITKAVVDMMADALDYAHGKGIIHRDVKPENVMVQIAGNNVISVTLLDFGLGLRIHESVSHVSGDWTGGTAYYKAPEQWRPDLYGHKLTAKADMYSLGAVAYEMLSGSFPFSGFDPFENAVLNVPPPVIDGLPDYVNDALQKALAKKPEDRFETCTAFVETLGRKPANGGRPSSKAGRNAREVPRQPQAEASGGPEHPRESGNPTIMLPGSVPLELVYIQHGTFMMGSPASEPGRYDDEVQHRVTLTRDFWLGKYPVTQGQWKAVMGTTLIDQANKEHTNEGDKHIGNIGDDYPMYYVNWNEASEFCRALTERELLAGRLPADYKYLLPTEAEWERACRAGTTTALYSGDIVILGENDAPALDGIAWYGGNSSDGYEGIGWNTKDWKEKQYPGGLAGPRRVGGKRANPWGLYDMIGNVLEWCRDWYGGYPAGPVTDPTGPVNGSRRVFRGGSWRHFASFCRSAFRDFNVPEFRYYGLGFRVALAPVQ